MKLERLNELFENGTIDVDEYNRIKTKYFSNEVNNDGGFFKNGFSNWQDWRECALNK